MSRIYALIILFFAVISVSTAQINTGIFPESIKNKMSIDNIDQIKLSPPSIETIQAEDFEDEKNGQMMKVARLLPIEISIKNSGTWEKTPDGRNIWRLKISSEGALACVLHFSDFSLPIGSQLFVYNPDGSVILGPYSSSDNDDGGSFAIGVIYGPEMIIEYEAPYIKSENGINNIELPIIDMSKFSYFYRGVELYDYRETGYNSSGSCQVNVNCTEGNNWKTQKKGVARIYVVQGGSGGYCTGTLINNTSNDQTPYFLTADHCEKNVTANDLGQWIFRFNYESPGCVAASQPSGNNITGCVKKSSGPLNGGSDFLLLQLNTNATNLKTIGAVYNGWRNSTTASPSGVSIHHPSGDIKKISTYTSTLATTSYNGGTGNIGATNAHWRVYWASTANGHGVTEGGSSGSPIFDNNGLVVGTLSGGSSFCDATYSPDLYGKMSYHWTSNGTTSSAQLKPWLDPSGTATICDFLDPNNLGVVCDFSGTQTLVITGGTVTFTDLSTGGTITSRAWSFPGGTPASSSAASPIIAYNAPGSYNVTLTVYSSSSNSTETKTGYIVVTNPGSGFTYDFEACANFAVDQFSPCTTYDGDQQTTFGSNTIDFTNERYKGSFIAFNPAATTPVAGASWAAHGGTKYGACFGALSGANNDWFITPMINLQSNSSFSFWAKSVTAEYGLERFNVYISTTNNNIGSFTKISSGSFVEAPVNWTKFTYNLASYNNQNIYLAIQCVSSDRFVFMIDDIVVSTEASVAPPVANFYGEPTSGCFPLTVNFHDQSTNNPSSRLWSFPGGTPATSTAQNPVVVYNSPGLYNASLKATNAGGNNTYTRSSYIRVNDCSPVFDQISTKVELYPNPTDGMLNINIPENRANVKVNNILGKEVKTFKLTSTENTIDLNSLSPGLYFIEIQLSETKITSKITVR